MSVTRRGFLGSLFAAPFVIPAIAKVAMIPPPNYVFNFTGFRPLNDFSGPAGQILWSGQITVHNPTFHPVIHNGMHFMVSNRSIA